MGLVAFKVFFGVGVCSPYTLNPTPSPECYGGAMASSKKVLVKSLQVQD